MKEFKRTYTMFEGGEVLIKGREQFIPQQRVKLVRPVIAGDEDEEDKFEVEFTNLGRATVDGCDLHPHPDSPATNVELLTHICDNGTTAMTQAFVVEAVRKVAEATVANADQVKAEMAGTMISGDLWVASAKEALDAINSRK